VDELWSTQLLDIIIFKYTVGQWIIDVYTADVSVKSSYHWYLILGMYSVPVIKVNKLL
jgi:hypothetical protein